MAVHRLILLATIVPAFVWCQTNTVSTYTNYSISDYNGFRQQCFRVGLAAI
jgi:hypothetical protein